MIKPRYLLIGGFLGAGKTTAILQVGSRLRQRGLRVGLITNDQSYGLVDTAVLSSHDFPVEEITGGCFCCKFNSLIEASKRLSSSAAPDTFIAEPVGSCTDLKATVDYPLRRIYGDAYSVAPLSVLIDPLRALQILGVIAGKSFSKKVVYIYCKQLEEAEIIVINKADLLNADQLRALRDVLGARFPAGKLLVISARTGEGVDAWIDQILNADLQSQRVTEVDYETYAAGEALLGWLNCTVQITGKTAPFDANQLLLHLIETIRSGLLARAFEVAHLKATITADEAGHEIAVANLVRTAGTAELSHRIDEPLDAGTLIINLRAEAEPELLRALTLAAVGAMGENLSLEMAIEHVEAFRPAKPQPTHRLSRV